MHMHSMSCMRRAWMWGRMTSPCMCVCVHHTFRDSVAAADEVVKAALKGNEALFNAQVRLPVEVSHAVEVHAQSDLHSASGARTIIRPVAAQPMPPALTHCKRDGEHHHCRSTRPVHHAAHHAACVKPPSSISQPHPPPPAPHHRRQKTPT